MSMPGGRHCGICKIPLPEHLAGVARCDAHKATIARIPFTYKNCPHVFVVLEKINADKMGLCCVAHRCFQFSHEDESRVNIYHGALSGKRGHASVETVTFEDLLERFHIVNSNGLLSPAGTEVAHV